MIGIFGAGKMGEALISGLLRAGYAPSGVVAVVRRAERADELRTAYGIAVLPATEAAKQVDTLIIAVKPQDMLPMLDEIAPHVPADKLVISVAAGMDWMTWRICSKVGTRAGRVVLAIRVSLAERLKYSASE